jgi:hypothetical protein
MKPIRSLFPSASLALLLLGSNIAAQEVAADGRPILNLSEIVLELYPVQNVDPDELYELAEELVGRSYYLQDHGDDALSNLRLLGTRIVLYDTLEQVKRARELLARLDVPLQASSSDQRAVEYRPRFVSLSTAKKAVGDLLELSLVPERGLIVLNGNAGDIESALALLKRIDVPEKQILLTCQLIEVGAEPKGPPLPKELVDNLQKLLPQSHFNQSGLAMLKASVGGEDSISVSIESESQDYRLAFTPVAFDESTASLTVVNCRLSQAWGDGERELFRTNTILRGGEYTVLAATGSTPILVVLRVTPQP